MESFCPSQLLSCSAPIQIRLENLKIKFMYASEPRQKVAMVLHFKVEYGRAESPI